MYIYLPWCTLKPLGKVIEIYIMISMGKVGIARLVRTQPFDYFILILTCVKWTLDRRQTIIFKCAVNSWLVCFVVSCSYEIVLFIYDVKTIVKIILLLLADCYYSIKCQKYMRTSNLVFIELIVSILGHQIVLHFSWKQKTW